MSDEDLLRLKLLNDERPLKKLMTRLYALAQLSDAASDARSEEEIEAQHVLFEMELDYVKGLLLKGKGKAVMQASAREVQSYADQVTRINAERQATMNDITSLQNELALAQQDRLNKIAYDAVTRDINKSATRAASLENIDRLQSDIASLLADQTKYADAWTHRKNGFDVIVKALEDLTSAVKEQSEAERRKHTLDDEDAGADNSGPASRMKSPDSLEEGETRDDRPTKLDPSAPEFEPRRSRREAQRPDESVDASMIEADKTIEEGEMDTR
ncbi:uncharacterized protein L969DRAFT_96888 [Mixia osmundae IAM 14324]|uniref:Uncharacterized protein n=1 Tax=Mixia osmundae (strain CBS 9802 / IAM 14324 / JCM 22182 / KY 12970) TaxID=764103 RepID=G7E2D9_MIXOS|nr:uncharacterized protein L969DRAFT_96888 [Mixia osmundae IAM 14324]KEI36870.1 hypothetical protein L969DRAFT_96888 [Mixia osmundae IAM 14324]GAA96999.1 hypothetical protein E5Q_03673 [Mixia osmundae IAM 14324]